MYNCTNITTFDENKAANIFLSILNLLLVIFICGGNILTIVAVWKTAVLRTIPNMYVVSLAAADLFIGAIAVPMRLPQYMPAPTYQELLNTSKFFCLTSFMSFSYSGSVSIFSIVLIAFDRAFSIGFPFVYQTVVTARKTLIIITAFWILALILASQVYFSNVWQPCTGCSFLQIGTKEFQIYYQCTFMILCSCLAGICYFYILSIARKHRKKIRKQNKALGVISGHELDDFKMIKLFLWVFGVFCICWGPLIIVIFLSKYSSYDLSAPLFSLVPWLAMSNSGMNFVVYGVYNKDFRLAFRNILSGLCCKTDREKFTPVPSYMVAS